MFFNKMAMPGDVFAKKVCNRVSYFASQAIFPELKLYSYKDIRKNAPYFVFCIPL